MFIEFNEDMLLNPAHIQLIARFDETTIRAVMVDGSNYTASFQSKEECDEFYEALKADLV